jgi:excisionase family DNA binding protein
VIPPEIAERVGLDFVELVRAVVREELEALLASLVPSQRCELLTYKQAGERIGKSADAVRMLVRRGRLEARKVGRSVLVVADSLDALGSPMMSPNKSMAPARLPPPEARPQEARLP